MTYDVISFCLQSPSLNPIKINTHVLLYQYITTTMWTIIHNYLIFFLINTKLQF